MSKLKRPIRIGNASGAIGDGIDQVYRLANSGSVDAITADYLAEFNIAWKAIELQSHPDLGYEPNFLEQLAWENGAGARAVASRRIKVVHDGGALNPRGLAVKVDEYFQLLGIHDMKVAWVSGDNVTEQVKTGELGTVTHLDYGHTLQLDGTGEDKQALLAANVYTGQRGILNALELGADIVICGRCCDASPVMALASWWHNWAPTDYGALAGSLMAGHLIECGAYVTGGNYCGAQEIATLHHVGYPIAEIAYDGTSVITKPEGTNGAVTVDTCTGQLLYEIQGIHYLNPDVVARIDGAKLVQIGPNRIRLTGIVGSAPPQTSKVSICLLGGYQAEICTYASGMDTDFKFNLMKEQVLGRINMADFSTFSIEKYGSVPASDPKSQQECTIAIRLFAQSSKLEAFTQFRRAVFYNGMQGYCGLHINMDWRTMEPKPYVKYIPALVKQSVLPELRVHFLNGESHQAPPVQADLLGKQAVSRGPWVSQSVPSPLSESSSGTNSNANGQQALTRRRLGDLFFARSGDKGGNANIGFWVRSDSAYPFAKSFLTEARLIQLLGDDWDANKHSVERCEFPHLRAIHFVIRGFLQEGVSSSCVLDGFGKSIGEFVRARLVDMPTHLVEEEDRSRTAAIKRAQAFPVKM